jgi:hypothetical protein
LHKQQVEKEAIDETGKKRPEYHLEKILPTIQIPFLNTDDPKQRKKTPEL